MVPKFPWLSLLISWSWKHWSSRGKDKANRSPQPPQDAQRDPWSSICHPRDPWQHPELSVMFDHAVTGELGQGYIERTSLTPKVCQFSNSEAKTLHPPFSSVTLAFRTGHTSQDTLPPMGMRQQRKPKTFSICLKSTTFGSYNSKQSNRKCIEFSHLILGNNSGGP